jgi:hypothetical protein
MTIMGSTEAHMRLLDSTWYKGMLGAALVVDTLNKQ